MLWPWEVLSNHYYFHDTVNGKSRLTSGYINNSLKIIFQVSIQEMKEELEMLSLSRN